jgi:hypothetical protein
MTGVWPKDQIDHRDLDRTNNRFDNLREATQAQNLHNTRAYCTNTSGRKGVSWHRRDRRWRVKIDVEGEYRWLGYFDDLEDAASAYAAAARELHGEFARVG